MVRALIMAMPDVYQDWSPIRHFISWTGGPSIAANCPGHDVRIADLVFKRRNLREGIDEALARTDPQVIGFSAMTFQYLTAVQIASYIRSEHPMLAGVPFILGGYHATCSREQVAGSAEGKLFDFLFAGESEHTFRRFLDGFDTAGPSCYEEIPGLSYRRSDGAWRHNPLAEPINSAPGLDTLVIPDREARLWSNGLVDTAETSRGCNATCKFCSIRQMMPGSRFGAFDEDRVIADLRRAKARGARVIFFTDDNPAQRPVAYKSLLRRIISEGLDDLYYSGMYSTSSMADDDLTRLMADAGVVHLFLGIEAIERDSLKLLRKGSSENLAARAVRNLKTAGISVMAGLILGNPDDTEESIRRTFRWCREQDVDEILAQFLTPYPGTEIRAELLREGLVEDPDQWRTYNGMFAHCRTRSGLMPADLEAIVYEEHSAFKRHRMAYAPELKFCDYRYNPVRDFGDNPGNSFHEKAAFARERWLKMNQFDLGRDGSATTAVRGEEVRA